jgi:hypothetical protein
MNIPGPSSPRNRRGALRRVPRNSIRLQCRRGTLGLGANLAVRFLNISESGVQLIASDLLRVGDEVEIVLEGHGFRGVIRRVAQVRWACPIETGGSRLGVRFSKNISFRELQGITI